MRVAALHEDSNQRELTRQTLEASGHDCHLFENSAALLRVLRRETFDLLLLDWLLPDFSGLEVLRWARAQLKDRIPVLFLTPRSAEADVVEGLEAGADDFVVMPVRTSELTARVNALLRRAYPPAPQSELAFGSYRFEPAARLVVVAGASVALKQKEFDLALFMFKNLGRLLSRKHLLQAVWGIDSEVASRSLDTHVSRVRTKLALVPERGYRLAAIYGVGYRLDALNAPASRAATTRLPAPL
jgi:DNA-binding response OmpR family regulator